MYELCGVREYCKANIEPSRRRGEKQRAGDIRTSMGYKNRMPLVCAALGTKKFEEFAGVQRVSLTGPSNGANAIFSFRLR
jgi:hypothetical protein